MTKSTSWLMTILALAALGAGACSRKAETGPGEVRWDREVCARCVMAVSDHHYSAQVRGGPEGKRTKLHFFDDLGCAVIWLEEQDWRDDPRTELWVADFRDGSWLDARSARYQPGKTTPMDYGLGAQPDPGPDTMDYEAAAKYIFDRNAERRAKHHSQKGD